MQDESGKHQDNSSEELGSGQPSGSKPATTSEPKGQKKITITEADRQKIISDAKAGEGRKWKAVEVERDQLKTEVGNLTNRLSEIEQNLTARAYEEARTDPTSLQQFNKEQAFKERERKVQERETNQTRGEAQLKADKEAFEADTGSTIVSVIAAKHGLEVSDLEDLGIKDREALDKVAARIKAGKPAVAPTETDEEKATREAKEREEGEFTPASELSSAAKAVGELTVEETEKSTMEALEAKVAPPIK